MKIVLLSASNFGNRAKLAIDQVQSELMVKHPQNEVTVCDLQKLKLVFSDGRNYQEYSGDTKALINTLMECDILVIATSICQASIPGSLKNVFDLLPRNALLRKTVSLIVSADSARHYLVAETQLKPILNYMKANLLPSYVFIEKADVIGTTIVNDDILFRIDKLVEDTMVLAETQEHVWTPHEVIFDY
ncbi:NADPH-dependent FMN reductase [Enterococcus sp. LJL120]